MWSNCFNRKHPKTNLMSKNYYEFTYIVNPVLEEEQYKEAVEKVNKLFTDNGSEIEEVDEDENDNEEKDSNETTTLDDLLNKTEKT